jgi:hypothetical protein
MKFTTAAVVALVCVGTVSAFVPQTPTFVRSTEIHSSTAEEQPRAPTRKEDRLKFMKNEQFHRRGFKEVREKVEKNVQDQFESGLVKDLKSSNYVVEKDGVTVHLAKV